MDAILFISGGSEFIHLAIQQMFIVYLPFADSVLVPIKDPGKKLIVYLGILFFKDHLENNFK